MKIAVAERLIKGPAYGKVVAAPATNADDSWPTFRHDAERTGATAASVSANLDEQWTVPLGGGFGRLMKFGNQPVNMRLEYYYNVEKPKAAPDQSVSFTFILLFPKK